MLVYREKNILHACKLHEFVYLGRMFLMMGKNVNSFKIWKCWWEMAVGPSEEEKWSILILMAQHGVF